MGRKEGRWQLIIVSVYVHCKTHRKRSDIEMNETLNLHRQRTKWTADIELDNIKMIHIIKKLCFRGSDHHFRCREDGRIN